MTNGFEMHIFSNLRLGKTQAKEAIRHGWSCVQGSRWVLGSVRRNASVRTHTRLQQEDHQSGKSVQILLLLIDVGS